MSAAPADFILAHRQRGTAWIPDLSAALPDGQATAGDALWRARQASGAVREYRVWFKRAGRWQELMEPEFRVAARHRWEVVVGGQTFAIERDPADEHSWRGWGWRAGGMGWCPTSLTTRAAAEHWCIDSIGDYLLGR